MASFASRTEFTRYFWAGSLAFAVDFSIFYLFTESVGLNYLWANLIGVCFGIVLNYLLCVSWVFVERRYSQVAFEFPLFVLLSVVGLAMNEFCLWIAVAFANVHHLVAKILVTFGIFIVNFYMKKIILFRRRINPS